MEYVETGKRIKSRRKELGMSAVQLADRLGLNKATIYRYENGEIKSVKLPIIEKIADVLSVNTLWLIGKSEEKERFEQHDLGEMIDEMLWELDRNELLFFDGEPIDPNTRKQAVIGLEVLRKTLM